MLVFYVPDLDLMALVQYDFKIKKWYTIIDYNGPWVCEKSDFLLYYDMILVGEL